MLAQLSFIIRACGYRVHYSAIAALPLPLQVHIEGEGMKLADGRIYVPLPFIHKNFPEESVWPVVLQADVYVNNECIRESHPVSTCLGGRRKKTSTSTMNASARATTGVVRGRGGSRCLRQLHVR